MNYNKCKSFSLHKGEKKEVCIFSNICSIEICRYTAYFGCILFTPYHMYYKNQFYNKLCIDFIVLRNWTNLFVTYSHLYSRLKTVKVYIHIMTIKLKNGKNNYDCQYTLLFIFFTIFFRVFFYVQNKERKKKQNNSFNMFYVNSNSFLKYFVRFVWYFVWIFNVFL